ncbi:MAG: response regulator [Acidimicrobiales bacterium]
MTGIQTVLVVDDEPMVSEVLTQYLTHDGFLVVEAADGEEAVTKLDACAPDLVLLDLMLPKKAGLEVLRHARITSDVPIIFLTALGDEKDRVAGLEMGADDYVVKPFSPREVAARVNRYYVDLAAQPVWPQRSSATSASILTDAVSSVPARKLS